MAIVSSTSEVVVMNAVGDSLRDAFANRSGFNIKAIVWTYTGGTPPVSLALEDHGTNVILALEGNDAQGSIQFEFPDRYIDDLEIDTIDVGTVYVYLR